VQALAYDVAARTFSPLWQGPSDAVGPPILSGGLVWSVATRFAGGEELYGLDPATGLPRYTITLPSPVADHFASPSAAGGRLFVATGSSVSAYQIARCPSGSGCPPAGTSPPGAPGGSSAGGAASRATSGSRQTAAEPQAQLVHKRLHATRRGIVRITLRCAPAAALCQGSISLHAQIRVIRGRGRGRRSNLVTTVLAHAYFGPARDEFTLTLRLSRFARALLRHHHWRLALSVVIKSTGSPPRRVAAVLT
jgi:hypothetical protein